MKHKTYKSTGAKILFIFILIIDVLFYFILRELYGTTDFNISMLKLEIGFGLPYLIFHIWLLNLATKKVIIDPKNIRYTSLFKKATMPLQDIKEYEVKNYSILLTDFKGNTLRLMKNFKLANWLDTNFANRNEIAYAEKVEAVLQDDRYGTTKEEREFNLNKADFFSNAVTTVVGVYMVSLLFFPLPIKWTMSVTIIATLLIIFGVIYYKGKLRIEWNTIYPSMGVVSFMTLILFSFSLMNYESYGDITRFLKMGLIISGLFSLYYIFIIVGFKAFKILSVVVPLLLLSGLITGSIYTLNVVLDTSEPEIFTTQIAEKEIRRGRYTTYEIDLASWNNLKNPGLGIDVSSRTFKKIKVGETVQIKHYQGRFGKQWYNVYKDSKLLTQNESLIGWLFNL
jgi:hypothetical protein